MRVLYLSCAGGISEGGIIGALIDAGADAPAVSAKLSAAGSPFSAGAFTVPFARTLPQSQAPAVTGATASRFEIDRFIARLDLGPMLTRGLTATLDRLREASSPPVSGVKEEFTVVDGALISVLAAAAAMKLLGIEAVTASALGLAVDPQTHTAGELPEVYQAARGIPIFGVPCGSRLATVHGAAFLAGMAETYGPPPAMLLTSSGRSTPSAGGGAVQALIGDVQMIPEAQRVVLIETNIDDMAPQLLDYVMQRLFESGALDVFFTPIQMKKNRPAIQLSTLASEDTLDACSRVLFSETTTLGLRLCRMDRICLAREFVRVETSFGPVAVKAAILNGRVRSVMPEYDDCRALAQQTGSPIRRIQIEASGRAEEELKARGWLMSD